MQNKKNGNSNIFLLIVGVMGSVFFIAIGYWLAAIIDMVVSTESEIMEAFVTIMSHPFSKYFNNLTPIAMAIGFILFEGIFIFMMKHRKSVDEDVSNYEPDIIDVAEQAGLDNLSDQELFAPHIEKVQAAPKNNNEENQDYVSAEEIKQAQENMLEESETESDNLSFDEDTVTELLECNFEITQIKAMMQIKKYNKFIDGETLKKLFKPTMSADAITKYISMFYE